jgi:4-carboxymuconolactone decarboxylase
VPPPPLPFAPAPDRRARGLDVLRTLRGGGDPQAAATAMERTQPEIAGDVIDFALGEVWATPALDRKTRSLQVVAMLAALGRTAGPLTSHINGALNHGATPADVAETLRMVAVYAGFPAALEAWPVMEQVFEQRGIPRPARPQ